MKPQSIDIGYRVVILCQCASIQDQKRKDACRLNNPPAAPRIAVVDGSVNSE
jgi:hypothetical protein